MCDHSYYNLAPGDLTRRSFRIIGKVNEFKELTIRFVTMDMAFHKVVRKGNWFVIENLDKAGYENLFRKVTIEYDPQFFDVEVKNHGNKMKAISFQDPIHYSKRDSYLDH